MSAAIEVPFIRTKRSKAHAFTTAVPKAAMPPRPSRAARMVALAHEMQRLMDRRDVKSHAELARLARVTRPRVSQLLDLLLLAPDIQEELLFAHTSSGQEPITERSLRSIVRCSRWGEQRRRWATLGSRHQGQFAGGETQCFARVSQK